MMKADEALKRLKEGNQRFVSSKNRHELSDEKRRAELTSGQAPWAIILSCADSRVVPELVFDTGLGELFVLRVAGNIANTDTIASIEYAVAHLKTKLVVVMGHENCGAVGAALAGGDKGYNLNHLLAQITPAINQCSSREVNDVVRKNALVVAKDLENRSSIISNARSVNQLDIFSAYYHLGSGAVDFL